MRSWWLLTETDERRHRPAVQHDQPSARSAAFAGERAPTWEAPAGDVEAFHRDDPDVPHCGWVRETDELEPRMLSAVEDVLPVAVAREVAAGRGYKGIVPRAQARRLVAVRVVQERFEIPEGLPIDGQICRRAGREVSRSDVHTAGGGG